MKLTIRPIEPDFKPFKAPNDILPFEKLDALDLSDYFISIKLDGIRMVVHNGKITSNSGLEVPNKYLYSYFKGMVELSLKYPNLYFDGEFYSSKLTFQEIFGYWNAHDRKFHCVSYTSESEIEGTELFYKIFDVFDSEQPKLEFKDRYTLLRYVIHKENFSKVGPVNIQLQMEFDIYKAVYRCGDGTEAMLKAVTNLGQEGLMLKRKDSIYKLGRATNVEKTFFKLKEFLDFDGIIESVVQATRVDKSAPTKINAQGYAVTSKKKEDRIPIEMAASFKTIYKDKIVSVPLTSLSEKERIAIWNNRTNLIGKAFTYKGMLKGAKEVPRSPKFYRFREN